MKFKLNIYFINGKDLGLVLSKEELEDFIDCMLGNKAYFDAAKNTGVGISYYNVQHYNYFEYTSEMRAADEERFRIAKEKAEAAKEEESK